MPELELRSHRLGEAGIVIIGPLGHRRIVLRSTAGALVVLVNSVMSALPTFSIGGGEK